MKNKKGFTLIEILVVVLIIGILAAIAVPQYQKSVWKSRATGMLFNLKSLHEAVKVYQLANSANPSNINKLDISLNNYKQACVNTGPSFTESSCKADKYSNLFLNINTNTGKGTGEVFSQFNIGPYKSGGFSIAGNTVICWEYPSYISLKGDFCKKIMGCQPRSGITTEGRQFLCPNL